MSQIVPKGDQCIVTHDLGDGNRIRLGFDRKSGQLEGETTTQFSPIAILDPAREVAAQVGHLAQLHAERPFRALKIQGTIIQSKITALLDEGRAFLDFARERDLPFLIHSSVLPQDIWSQSHDILKVVEAAPDLRFILAHSCRFEVNLRAQKSSGAGDRLLALIHAYTRTPQPDLLGVAEDASLWTDAGRTTPMPDP